MKQLFYEIKKVFGQRFFVLIAAALLLISTGLGIFSLRERKSPLRNAEYAECYRLYNENPDAARALFEEYAANSKAGIEVPDTYGYLRGVFRAAESNSAYPGKLLKVSESARRKALELEREGYGEGDFIYDYQKNCELLYRTAAESVELPTAIVSGWANYFSQSFVTYFILAAVFLLVCAVYVPEKTDGVYPLLRSTKRGRYALSGAKLGAVLLLTVAITVIFSGASFAAVAVKLGFSSPDMPVQVIASHEYCPYLITVGEYFVIHSVMRLLGVLVFALICAAVTTVKCDYVISFSGAAILLLVNYLLDTVSYASVNSPARHLNLFSVCDAGGIFERYFAVDFFGSLARFRPFGLCIFIPLFVAAGAFAYLAIARGRGHLNSPSLISRITKMIKLPEFSGKKKSARLPLRRCSLASFEAHKIFGKVGIVIILLLIVIVRIDSAQTAYASPREADEIFYREYMEHLDGEYTEEKAEYLRAELKLINSAIQKYEKQMESGWWDISIEEQSKIISDANYAYSHKSAAERANSYANKLRELVELGEKDAFFLYDSGWRLILSRDADLLAFALILLALCNVFGIEFGKSSSSGRFADILRATKRGRGNTFFAKLTVAALTACTVFLVFEAVDVWLIIKNYTLPHADGASVVIFDKVQNDGAVRYVGVTLADFLSSSILLRLFATAFFTCGVFALSSAVKKNISVMLISALALLLPSAISGTSGLTVLSKVDLLPLASGAEIIKLSEAATPAAPFSMPLTAVIILFLAAIAIITAARAAWCNPYHKTRRLKI